MVKENKKTIQVNVMNFLWDRGLPRRQREIKSRNVRPWFWINKLQTEYGVEFEQLLDKRYKPSPEFDKKLRGLKKKLKETYAIANECKAPYPVGIRSMRYPQHIEDTIERLNKGIEIARERERSKLSNLQSDIGQPTSAAPSTPPQ